MSEKVFFCHESKMVDGLNDAQKKQYEDVKPYLDGSKTVFDELFKSGLPVTTIVSGVNSIICSNLTSGASAILKLIATSSKAKDATATTGFSMALAELMITIVNIQECIRLELADALIDGGISDPDERERLKAKFLDKWEQESGDDDF